LIGVAAGTALAVTSQKSVTGTAVSSTYNFTGDGSFSVSRFLVDDTGCDGHSAQGAFQSEDAYGDVFTYTTHTNSSGCGTRSTWTNLSGSDIYGIHQARVRAHTAGTSITGSSAWSVNPYFGD
jgi:hypothetical protein